MRRLATFALLVGCTSSAPAPSAEAPSVIRASRALAPAAHRGLRWSDSAAAFVRPTLPGAVGAEVPSSSDGLLRLHARGTVIDVKLAGLVAARGVEESGAVVYHDAAPSTDVVIVDTPEGIEELRVLRDSAASSTFRWRITVPEGHRLRVRDNSLAVLDVNGVVQAATAPITAVDKASVTRDLALSLAGDELVATLDTKGLAYPIVVDPSWTATPPMRTVRSNPWAAKISGTRVLVGGGQAPWVQIYDGGTNDWTNVPDLPIAWSNSRAIALATGDVLVVAGDTTTASTRFRPATSTWAATGAQAAACGGCALTLLKDGRVLKLPGASGTVTPEVFNPTTGNWSNVAALTYSGAPVALTLDDGRVFVFSAGGSGQSGYLYNPTSNSWATTPTTDKHLGPVIAKLADDRVMLAGQTYGGSGTAPPARVWAPATNTWSEPYAMVRTRESPGLVRLASGRILAVGGKAVDTTYPTDGEIWDPLFKTWTLLDPFPGGGRMAPATALLDDGSVLVAGGSGSSGPTGSAFRFVPLADGASCAAPNFAAACKASYCVDGVCCNAASCPGGVCNAPAVPGRPAGSCAKNLGQSCTAASDCASGFCVDGVCCNEACGGQCQACTTAGAPGTCLPVKGAPMGSRPACAGGDTCAARACDGKDPLTCAGYAAAAGAPCGTPKCDGSNVVPAASCDGAGACVAPMSSSCGKFACDPATVACRTSCAIDRDCAAGFFCLAGTCSEGARCSDDRSESLSTTGEKTACSPYRCGIDGSGNCGKSCATSDDCAGGFVCDRANGATCVPGATTADEGGCSTTPGTSSSSGSLALLIAVAAILARRRK